MNPAQLLQHFSRLADAPDAIPRLRRFILDLAVRGKLVEQNPRDEAASALLMRIQAEKEQRGRIARFKKTAAASKVEPPFSLPKGWSWAPLSDLVTVLNGRAYSQNELLAEGTPILRVGNLFTSKQWYYSNLELEDDKYCDEGDLIFSWSASFGPFIWQGPKVIYHYHIWKLELHSERDLDKLYLYRFLSQKTQEIKDSGHGISMIHMTKEKMELLQVPVPPLVEQHRIVAKVDELMGLCDRLEAAQAERERRRERLTATTLARTANSESQISDRQFFIRHFPRLTTRPDQIPQLRHTILNLAVRGQLVAQNPKDKAAPSFGVTINSDDTHRIALEIPQRWSWAKVEDVAEARLGKMLDKTKNKGRPYRYLGNTNVHWFDIRMDDLKELRIEDAEIAKYILRNGDVLICEGGHGIGRTAVWRSPETDIVFQKALHRVRPGPHLNSDFFAYCLCVYFHAGILQAYYTGVGIPHFTGAAMTKLVFPLPPFAEQHRIVAKVQELMALCDRLEAKLTTNQTESRRLLESVLHQALAA